MSDIELMQTNEEEEFDLPVTKRVVGGSEDGELTDSDTEDIRSRRHAVNHRSKAFTTNGKDSTKHSIFDDDDLAKMEERASRFGLDKASDDVTLEKDMKDLYDTLGVSSEDIRHMRFDTIHIRGTDKMNTNDIFEYFFSHKPTFLEWINDNSCNVVWKDDISAARAMVFYSKVIKTKNIDIGGDVTMDESVPSDDVILEEKIPIPIPPGKWRGGAPHPKAEFIFLRFANKSDRKASGTDKLKVYSKKYNETQDQDNVYTGIISESMKSKIKAIEKNIPVLEDEKFKNPWGELCETWGINDSQEVFGIDTKKITIDRLPPLVPRRRNIRDRIGIPLDPRLTMDEGIRNDSRQGTMDINLRLGKRQIERDTEVVLDTDSEEPLSSDEEWTTKSKVPRMRMHADDEQEKVKTSKKVLASPWDEEISLNTIMVEVNNETTQVEDTDVRSRLNKNYIPTSAKWESLDSKSDLRSRLGFRKNSYESESDDDYSENVRGRSSVINKVQPTLVQRKPTVASTVWSRLDIARSKQQESYSGSDSENENVTDLRHTIAKSNSKTLQSDRPGFQKSDLRSRLGKKNEYQRSPLRIEVDNEFCRESD